MGNIITNSSKEKRILSGCKMQDARCMMHDTRYWMLDPECRILDTGWTELFFTKR
jgi:hypothetical protein